jgi:biopolymer transport protein ExbD
MHLMAAPFAALFVLLACIVIVPFGIPRGLVVRMPRTEPCGFDNRLVVVVRVLSTGGLKINLEDVTQDNLGHRLEELFKTRVYRWVLVEGAPDLSFGAVADVIDTVSGKVDYVTILTPSVLKQADMNADICIDPNLPPDYIAHPPR